MSELDPGRQFSDRTRAEILASAIALRYIDEMSDLGSVPLSEIREQAGWTPMANFPSEQVEEKLRFLLEGILMQMRGVQSTRKTLEIVGIGAAAKAWQDLIGEYPDVKRDKGWSPADVIAGLDRLIVQSLAGSADPSAMASPLRTKRDIAVPGSVEESLGVWSSDWLKQLVAIDPQAPEIVALRLQGFDDRAVAEGLDSGLRLVRRIIADVRTERTLPIERSESEEAVAE